MGVFDKIGDAKSSEDSNYVRPGQITARITECKMHEKYDGTEMMLINMVVLSVQDGDHKVGEEITHFLKVKQASFLGNVKQFVCSTLDCSPDDVGQAEAERIVSDENPLGGMEVSLKARVIKTREGNDFTKITYYGQVQAGGSESAEE